MSARAPVVVYLYTEIMGYTLATIRELVAGWGAEVHVVHWDTRKLTPYAAEAFPGLHLYPRSAMTEGDLSDWLSRLEPDMAVVSGWQDRGYLPAARWLRQRGCPVVVGFDDQWKGTLRQRLGACLGAWRRAHFSHAWVAGDRQYEYARRMGFPTKRIVRDLYSADLSLFAEVPPGAARTRRFLFVGRLEEVKGVDVLGAAWCSLGAGRDDWELRFIGIGREASWLAELPSAEVRPFSAAAAVRDELTAAAAFVLPSRHEPWGVVVHEAVAAGLPVLCSNAVGAADHFVVDGYNGRRFRPGSIAALAEALRWFMNKGEEEWAAMRGRSAALSRRITPATSAANLMAVLRGRESGADA